VIILQLATDGLTFGFLYGLLAISFAAMLHVTKIWHFAHAATFTAGAYVLYAGTAGLGLPLWVAVIAAVIVTGALGIAYDRWAYQPLRDRNSGSLTFFMASLVLSTLLENVIALGFGVDPRYLPQSSEATTYHLGSLTFTDWSVHVALVSLTLFGLSMAFFRYTRAGQAAIAVATNPTMAEVIGIDTPRIYRIIFGLGSALTVPVAYLLVSHTDIRPAMGLGILLPAVVATVVGGIGSLPGAFVAGLLLGVLQSVSVWRLPSQWQTAIAYVVLFFIIIFRPTGLFGEKLASAKV
jgi:branched-chain amino acid transport system permease protein